MSQLCRGLSCFSKGLSLENLPIYQKNTGADPASQNKSAPSPEENRPRGWENIEQSLTPVELTEGRHGGAPQTLVGGAYKGAFFKEFQGGHTPWGPFIT